MKKYVNAYSVDRSYGGPEEGGWWYDAGELLESQSCHADDEEALESLIEDAKADLRKKYGPEFEGIPHRNYTNGGPNLEIYVEDHPGENFPERKPHYE